MEKLLTYALKDGVLTHVLNVPNGKECGCLCPKCFEPLVAKANIKTEKYKKEPHFAHSSGSDCSGAYESALHLLAKKILKETKQIQLPDFHFDYNSRNQHSIYKSLKIIDFEEVVDEQRLKTGEEFIVADVECRRGEKKLFVEFAHTHFVDSDKKRKIKNGSFPFIEIDLSDQILKESSIKDFLLSKSPKIYWIANPVLDKGYIDDLEIKAKAKSEEKNQEIIELKTNNLNVIQVIDNKVRICPKKIDFFGYFKKSKYYSHPILKEIADGKFWNEKIYGHYSWEEYIYFQGKKIHTSLLPNLGGQLPDDSDLLRSGLKAIIERKDLDLRLCNFCKYYDDSVVMEPNKYQLCSFKLESGLIKDV